MRIALCGPGGSGKSSLSELISKKYDLVDLSSACREASSCMGIVSGNDLGELPLNERINFQTLALSIHCHNEIKNSKGFVSARSVFDFFCYMETFLPIDSQISRWYHLIPSMMGAGIYDHVFFIPPFSESIENDGMRYTGDVKWIEESVSETMFDKSISMYPNIKFVRGKSIDSRIEEIVSEIEKGRLKKAALDL
jgi:hypothetical protein